MESTIIKTCESCKYFKELDSQYKFLNRDGFCCRFPQHISTILKEWCGEWKKK
jgi:hypothetical protein